MHEGGDDEYESLPDSAGPAVHMVAGAMAGMLEHCVMFPFDTVKTRLQRLNPEPSARYTGPLHAFRTMVAVEGVGSLFRGLGVAAAGAGPAHALYFASYEGAKSLFGANEGGHQPVRTAAAALTATLAHDAFMNPTEVVKQRLQVYHSPYRSAAECVRKIAATEGVGAFYRSFSTQLVMNMPYQTVHLVAYEFLRRHLNPAGDYDPPTHLLAGAGAGGLAAAVTTPFDVAKTLLNTQEACPGANAAQQATLTGRRYISGLASAMRTVYEVSGPTGFAKGLSARVCFAAPATAISWSVYEFLKHTLFTASTTAPATTY